MKTGKREEAVLALHYEGWTAPEIAELEGIGVPRVQQILYALGERPNMPAVVRKDKKVDRNAAICLAYQTDNVSIRDLAKLHDITFERVAQILRKENLIEMREARRVLAKEQVASELAVHKTDMRKVLRDAATFVLEGYSMAEASRRTGLTMNVIQAHCKALGVLSRHGKHRDFEPRKARVRALHAEGLSFTDIVERMRSEGDPINYQWIWRNVPELRPQPGGRWNPRDRRVDDPENPSST